jgi:hypothetical protein
MEQLYSTSDNLCKIWPRAYAAEKKRAALAIPNGFV